MRKLVLLMTALLVGGFSFAGAAHLSKRPSTLGAIAAAWKTKSSSASQTNTSVNVIYVGEDMATKSLELPTAVA